MSKDGPGTPIFRLEYLLNQLKKRFPGTISDFSSASHEHAYLEKIDELIKGSQTSFSLDVDQRKKLGDWIKIQYQEIAEEQLKDPERAMMVGKGKDGTLCPYFGANGGSLTYQFIPTSIGLITDVILCKGTSWERKLELTDFSTW